MAIVIVAFVIASCSDTNRPKGSQRDAIRLQRPGSSEDFAWEWTEVAAVDLSQSYAIPIRFTNTSDRPSTVPDCWVVPSPGQAAALIWDRKPILDPGEQVMLRGVTTFKWPILEIDEVVCDPEVAQSYRD